MIICPSCKGIGSTLIFGDGLKEVQCSTCRGGKAITLEHHEKILLGRKMREERLGKRETLRNAAKRIGITPTELSKLEQGQI